MSVVPLRAAINSLTYANVIGFLLTGQYSQGELVELTGMAPRTVQRCLVALRRVRIDTPSGVAPLLRVAGWVPDAHGRPQVREWTLNAEGLPDASRPKASTSAQRTRAWRERLTQARLLNKLPEAA